MKNKLHKCPKCGQGIEPGSEVVEIEVGHAEYDVNDEDAVPIAQCSTIIWIGHKKCYDEYDLPEEMKVS